MPQSDMSGLVQHPNNVSHSSLANMSHSYLTSMSYILFFFFILQNTKQYKQDMTKKTKRKYKYGKQNKSTCTQALALCKIALRCC